MNADYIIVGAGSAGCALAHRLSEDPKIQVLLLEAGPNDKHPMIKTPKGFALLMGNPNYAWHFPVGYHDRKELWVRGKVLGGSSAINGMIYNRGSRADFDKLAELGNPEWGWDNILAAYKAIEDNAFGASPTRGAGGPLHVSPFRDADPICKEVIAAGSKLGWDVLADCNESDAERIGYAMCTVKNGTRFSAARAFLHSIAGRPNLTVKTGARAVRLLREGERITGVAVREEGALVEYKAGREVILSLGNFGTPKLLQLSGIGPSAVLRAAGVDVVVDSPNVGAKLREHMSVVFHYRLNRNVGYNRVLSSKLGQMMAGLRYLIDKRGIISMPPYDIIAFLKTDPSLSRPDAQLLIAPFSLAGTSLTAPAVEREPGLQCTGYILRPESEGRVAITAADPDANLEITPNLLASAYDRKATAALYGAIRKLFSTAPIADYIDHETQPGPAVAGDEDRLIDETLRHGFANAHGVGTAAMGPDANAVVDPKLKVRGVKGLRVVDTSVFPTMVAGNTNGPAMALGWHAGHVILSDS